jgi:hypothetical protein
MRLGALSSALAGATLANSAATNNESTLIQFPLGLASQIRPRPWVSCNRDELLG